MSEERPTNPSNLSDVSDWESSNLWQPSAVTTLSSGDRIGDYEIVDLIGEGGFGVVYLAEQKKPVTRRVALKIIKPGMDSSAVIARFEAERQALAVMNHPHVAKVLGGGATPDNRPYFVMEYVQGKPITTYCDEHRLSIEDRVELFIQVCEAIQHAHMKGLIHRDLKPANVLVEVRSDKPMPKVIDFGVAKALQREEETKQTFTLAGELIGTPEYMSPEQADPQGVDIDTRTDVYSLGVLLYELLTGSPPFDVKTLMASGYSGLQHIITQIDPPIPSSRLSTWGSTARKEQTPRPGARPSPSHDSGGQGDAMTPERVASERGTDSRSLVRRLRGDLDWIVMKCLEKDRDRRYDTAAALAMELRRHINNEPVLAGPPSTMYRLRKFVRRNRTGVVAGSAIAAMLVLCAVVSVLFAINAMESERRADAQAAEAQRQEEIAAAVNTFLTDDLIKAASPERLGRDVSMREVLHAAAIQLEHGSGADGRFIGKPEVKAGIHRALGQTYLGHGLYEEAHHHLERQLILLTDALGEKAVPSLEAHLDLGQVYRRMGRYELAHAHVRTAYDGLLSQLGEDDSKTLAAIASIGGLYLAQRKVDEAEPYFAQALERYRRTVGDDDPDTLRAINNMGALLRAKGEDELAEPYYREAMEGFRRVYGDDHPDTLTAINNMGVVLRSLDRMDEAMPYYREALEGRRRVLGNDHDRTLTSINNMGHLLLAQGLREEALEYFREAHEGLDRVMGEGHPFTLNVMQTVGQVLRSLGRLEEAEPYYRESLRLMRETQHPRLETAISNLSLLFQAQDRYHEAEPLALELYELRLHQHGREHLRTIFAQQPYAAVLREVGRFEESKEILLDALEAADLTLGEQSSVAGVLLTSLSRTYMEMDRLEDAKASLALALEIFNERGIREDHESVIVARQLQVQLQQPLQDQEPP